MADPIPTIGGYATVGEAYVKLMYHMEEAQNLCAVIAHLENAQGNTGTLLARGWLGISELLKQMQHQITKLAQRKLQ